jgi:hypothetical protein
VVISAQLDVFTVITTSDASALVGPLQCLYAPVVGNFGWHCGFRGWHHGSFDVTAMRVLVTVAVLNVVTEVVTVLLSRFAWGRVTVLRCVNVDEAVNDGFCKWSVPSHYQLSYTTASIVRSMSRRLHEHKLTLKPTVHSVSVFGCDVKKAVLVDVRSEYVTVCMCVDVYRVAADISASAQPLPTQDLLTSRACQRLNDSLGGSWRRDRYSS